MVSPETIDSSGYPLAFKTRQGSTRPGVITCDSSRDVFTVEARQFAGHQREAVVTEGAAGSSWRMVSDEGVHIKGTDLAPFPFGFFNAGLHADLINRLQRCAQARSLPLSALEIHLITGYSMSGAFFRGDGKGYAEPARIKVKIGSAAGYAKIAEMVAAAVNASPALAAMRRPLVNTFALYVNGRRRAVTTLANSTAPDAPDPFRTYQRPPQPLAGANALPDLIRKTGEKREGTPVLTPPGATATARIIRIVAGTSRLLDPRGVVETDTCLELPGMSHFALKSDERGATDAGDQAPSGLALLSAGIAFCYMTQLSRYIEYMKYNIRAVRLVQYSPYAVSGSAADGSWSGGVEPVDTHLFLSGEETDETHEKLMRIAANTCFLHATLADRLEPVVSVEHNGKMLECD